MKILSIDTSSKICSVSILEDTDLIIEKHIENELTHSQKLMPLVDEILKSNNVTLSDFDLFACSVGPGSFTGVRIGVSTVKAFNDVTNIKIASVSSLESLAYNTLNSNYKNDANLVLSIIDAKNDNVYFGLFQLEQNNYTQIGELDFKNISEVISSLKSNSSPITFVGDGSILYSDLLKSNFDNCLFCNKNDLSSYSLGIAGLSNYKKGISSSVMPLYLRKSQAERALEEKSKNTI